MSKARSQASFRIMKMDSQRAMNFNSDLTLKLSYAWKHIYRSLLAVDILQKGIVPIKKLNQVLLNNKISLTKEEIRRLLKLS